MLHRVRGAEPPRSLGCTARLFRQTVTWHAVMVAASIALLWIAASLLARTAHQQRMQRATRAATRAEAATAAKRGHDAVAFMREAVVLEPNRPEYRLALAKALVTVGQPAEAEPYVQEALREEPVNGEANLVLARILDQQGNRTEAERAFYRAIYGRWPTSGQSLRTRARLELVDLYRRSGERGRLRAALLELSTAFPGDRALQLQAGRDLLAAGFSDDAARQLRVVVERFADAGDALSLLAKAEFARRNYVDAYSAASRAVARDGDDDEAAALRGLSARVLGLDPDQPRLSSRERLTRLRVLLSHVRTRMGRCDAGKTGDGDSLLPLIDQWLARRSPDADLGRTLLEGAVRRLPPACLPPPETDAIGRVLADLVAERRR